MQNEQVIAPYHITDLTGRRVLVLAPHPDDETIGCGGSIARHCLAGDAVKIAFLTDGAKGDMTSRYEKSAYIRLRRTEAKNACRCIGVHDLDFWEYEDRMLADAYDAVDRLITLLAQFCPELVYVPSPLEFHPDHRAAAFLLKNAILGTTGNFDVAFYEISQPMIVNTLVDITPVLDKKQKALAMYESQLSEKNYEDISLALSRFRSLTLTDQVTHAEGFCVHTAEHIKSNCIFSMFYPDVENLQDSRQKSNVGKISTVSGLQHLVKKFLFHRKQP